MVGEARDMIGQRGGSVRGKGRIGYEGWVGEGWSGVGGAEFRGRLRL